MPVLSIFAIAFIIAILSIPTKKTAPAPSGSESGSENKDDAGDLLARALEKYLKEEKNK